MSINPSGRVRQTRKEAIKLRVDILKHLRAGDGATIMELAMEFGATEPQIHKAVRDLRTLEKVRMGGVRKLPTYDRGAYPIIWEAIR